MDGKSTISPRAALAAGLVAAACGVLPILGALEIIPLPLTPGTPVWVGVCAGVLFLLAGAAVINGYAIQGRDTARHAIQNMLGVSICALFAAISGWIAFGPGERQFSTSWDLPFYSDEGRGSELIGRAAFGVGMLMVIAIAMVSLITGFRRRKP
jgi:hypothetical protein